MKGWANNQTESLSCLCPVLCRRRILNVWWLVHHLTPTSHLFSESLFVLGWLSIFFFFQNCTKPNQTTTRDSLIYFHPHTKCSWFIQSLGFPWRVSGIASFFFFFCRKNQIFSTLKKPTLHYGAFRDMKADMAQRSVSLALIWIAPFVFYRVFCLARGRGGVVIYIGHYIVFCLKKFC